MFNLLDNISSFYNSILETILIWNDYDLFRLLLFFNIMTIFFIVVMIVYEFIFVNQIRAYTEIEEKIANKLKKKNQTYVFNFFLPFFVLRVSEVFKLELNKVTKKWFKFDFAFRKEVNKHALSYYVIIFFRNFLYVICNYIVPFIVPIMLPSALERSMNMKNIQLLSDQLNFFIESNFGIKNFMEIIVIFPLFIVYVLKNTINNFFLSNNPTEDEKKDISLGLKFYRKEMQKRGKLSMIFIKSLSGMFCLQSIEVFNNFSNMFSFILDIILILVLPHALFQKNSLLPILIMTINITRLFFRYIVFIYLTNSHISHINLGIAKDIIFDIK